MTSPLPPPAAEPRPGPRTPILVLGVLGVVALVALNLAALIGGWADRWLAFPVIATDALVLGLVFGLAWRRSLAAEEILTLRMEAQRKETERMQSALSEAQARHAAIVESAMDAVITIDAAQRIVVFNQAAEAVFGCPRGEALGTSMERFLPPRFRAGHAAHVAAFGLTGQTNRRMGDTTTLWALRADGTEFPIEASISHARVDGDVFYTVILRDITRRKAAEDALRASQAELRELSAQVLQAREDEKTHIARELHDELGQSLTALKMDLAWLRGRLPGQDAELARKAQAMNATLDATVAATRRIAANLRPLMLDDLGLADAAEWLVEDFSERNGIACTLDMDNEEVLLGLPRPLATALYRILQESLTNIARHAGAATVRVTLRCMDNQVQLVVQDDGRGLSEQDRAKPTSFGLRGMRERAHYLGGQVLIDAVAEGGTRLKATIPLGPGDPA